jgi:hypothetical protein
MTTTSTTSKALASIYAANDEIIDALKTTAAWGAHPAGVDTKTGKFIIVEGYTRTQEIAWAVTFTVREVGGASYFVPAERISLI